MTAQTHNEIRRAIATMKRGDCLQFPLEEWGYIRTAACRTGKVYGRYFSVTKESTCVSVTRTDFPTQRTSSYGYAYRTLNGLEAGQSCKMSQRNWKKAQNAAKTLRRTKGKRFSFNCEEKTITRTV